MNVLDYEVIGDFYDDCFDVTLELEIQYYNVLDNFDENVEFNDAFNAYKGKEIMSKAYENLPDIEVNFWKWVK